MKVKTMIRLKYLFLMSIFFICLEIQAQKIGVKSNVLADVTGTLNLGAELGLGNKTTLDFYANYNAWKYGEMKQFKHFLFQPEYRHWFCEKFNGHFIGVHAHGGIFNVGGIKMPFSMWTTLKEHRYEGWFYGAGISYGYQWVLNKHWNIEANIGVGYALFHYDKYQCDNCNTEVSKDATRNYFGPTKAAVSLIYLF